MCKLAPISTAAKGTGETFYFTFDIVDRGGSRAGATTPSTDTIFSGSPQSNEI